MNSRHFFDRLSARLHPHTKGRWAEYLALTYLVVQGYKPVFNRRLRPAQIDLLMRHGSTLVMVEVKFRRHTVFCPYAVHPQQMQRQARAAQLLAGLYPHYSVRADIIFISPQRPFIQHIKNAFPLA